MASAELKRSSSAESLLCWQEKINPHPQPFPVAPRDRGRSTSSLSAERRRERAGYHLPQLLDLVERAARGDAQLGRQLFAAMEQLVQNPAAPQDQRELARYWSMCWRARLAQPRWPAARTRFNGARLLARLEN